MSHAEQTFAHCASIYASEQQFLEAAVPFLTGGLALRQPVLAVATPAHLELLSAALGARNVNVDYAASASLGDRPARRVAAYYRYWTARRDSGHHGVRILAEPLWGGRSVREITAWTRMEAALNVTLAGTGISMLCPYDGQALDQGIIANARHTHPMQAAGPSRSRSPGYADPARFALSCDTAPLASPPRTAEAYGFDGDLRGLRRFIAGSRAARGMAADRTQMLILAASEVCAYLKSRRWPAPAAVHAWAEAAGVVCDFRQPGGSITDPFLGLRPAGLAAGDGDGLWLANQICDRLDIRSAGRSCAIQMRVAG